MIIVFTGNGKGKTSAAAGTLLRALNNNKTVHLIQFLKDGNSGEIRLLKKLLKNGLFPELLSIKCFGKKQFTDPKSLKKIDYELADRGLKAVNKAIEKRPFLIILDEILVAENFGLLKSEDVLSIISICKESGIHLILTGRGANDNIIKESDLVSTIRNTKHPFDTDIKAIKGIDY